MKPEGAGRGPVARAGGVSGGGRRQLIYRQERHRPFGIEPGPGERFILFDAPLGVLGFAPRLRPALGLAGPIKAALKTLSGTRFLYVLVRDGVVAHHGWVTTSGCRHYRVDAGAAVIGPINTPAEHRCRGAATTALRCVMDRMLARGHRVFFIDTSDDNAASRRVMEKCGFGAPIGSYLRWNGHGPAAGEAGLDGSEGSEGPEGPGVPMVVHVVISLACGGLERLAVWWTNERNRRFPGMTLLCCLDEPGELAEQVEGGAVRCLRACRSKFPFDVGAVLRLRAIVRAGGRGGGGVVVHSHNLAAQQYAALAVLGTGTRHCHTQHGANLHNLGFRGRLASRVLSRLTHVVVAVSAATAAAMARNQGLDTGRIRVIPNGVPARPETTAEERDRLRLELRIDAGVRVAGSVGRLAPVKGYDRLLRAWRGVRDAAADAGGAVLVLVGDGPARFELERLAMELGIDGLVRFPGFRADAGKILALMDLFVLPSRGEGLSIGLLEAMSAGVPVCVTDVGENRAVIGDGEAGFLLPEDEAAWPAVLGRLISAAGREEAARRARRARVVATERYGLARGVEAYETIYRGLAASGG